MVEIEIVKLVFYAVGIFALGLVVGAAFGFVMDTILYVVEHIDKTDNEIK